jgi:hypothetical protein
MVDDRRLHTDPRCPVVPTTEYHVAALSAMIVAALRMPPAASAFDATPMRLFNS